MLLQAAKYVGAGLATIGLAGAGVGIGCGVITISYVIICKTILLHWFI